MDHSTNKSNLRCGENMINFLLNNVSKLEYTFYSFLSLLGNKKSDLALKLFNVFRKPASGVKALISLIMSS